MMVGDLIFASEEEALQHLAEVTGQKIVVSVDEESLQDDVAEEQQEENAGERFRSFFMDKLNKFDTESLDDLDDKQKSQFFAEIEAEWIAQDESGEAKNAKVAAGNTKTFKCPDCSSKVLENTKYCVKCKKKVKAKE